jgi:hypothetical protein
MVGRRIRARTQTGRFAVVCGGDGIGLVVESAIAYAFQASGGAGWELSRLSCCVQ